MHLKNPSLLLLFWLFLYGPLTAQTLSSITDTILYFQATAFSNGEADVSNPHPAVFSNDGERLVFSVFRDNAGKVYTMNADGSELQLIYDYASYRLGCPCRAPFVDISGDGSTVCWTDGTGEIFIADFDGGNRVVAADTIPHANPNLVDVDPIIRLAPQLTYDGSLVYFFSNSGGRPTAGLYTVGRNGGGLTRLFSAEDVAMLLLGDPNATFNINLAFESAFVMSDDGSKGAFASHIDSDNIFEYGHIVGFDGGGGLEVLSAIGPPSNNDAQPISLSLDGKRLAWLRRLPGTSDHRLAVMDMATGATRFEEQPLHSSSPVQLDSAGLMAMVEGTVSNTKYPLLLEIDSNRAFSPILLEHTFPLNWFESRWPALAPTGTRLAFYDDDIISDQQQLFLAEVNPDSIPAAYPLIGQVAASPGYVLDDGSSTATFTVGASPGAEPIQAVLFNTLIDGLYHFRALAVEGLAFKYPLFDDGTQGGDVAAGDGLYTQNGVVKDQVPAPAAVTVRFFALGGRYITAMDMAPFYISSEPIVGTEMQEADAPSLRLYPVPAKDNLQLELGLPSQERVEIVLLDTRGRRVQEVFNGSLPAGNHRLSAAIGYLPSGVYWCGLRYGGEVQVVRMVMKE